MNFLSREDIQRELNTAIRASVKAGEAIMEIYENEDFQTRSKVDDSPLTIADLKANDIIEQILNGTGIPIISEETKLVPYEIRENWTYCWIVDPLDGTKEFIKRNGEFTVNIALIEEGKPILGVIYVPTEKILYFGNVQEKKAFTIEIPNPEELERDWKNLKFEQLLPSESKENLKIVGSRSHMSKDTIDFIYSLEKEYNKNVEIVSKGSSLKFCLVAKGMADIYPRFAPTMEWDTAAGQAICEAVGLKVIDQATGAPMIYNRKNLLNNSFLVS